MKHYGPVCVEVAMMAEEERPFSHECRKQCANTEVSDQHPAGVAEPPGEEELSREEPVSPQGWSAGTRTRCQKTM